MATRNIVFGSGSGNQEIDVIDILALVILPIAASMIFGVFTLSIDVFGGYDFSQALWTIGGADISPALLLFLGSFAWIVVTNIMNERTDMGEYEMGAIVAGLALPLMYVFIPAVGDLVEAHDLFRLAGVIYVGASAVYVSYVG